MGRERECEATLGGRRARGKALLESEELIFRAADFRVRWPFRAIVSVESDGDALRLRTKEEQLVLALGRDAAAWAEAIRSPKSVLDKLGVRVGARIALAGAFDDELVAALRGKGDVALGARGRDYDCIFFAVRAQKDLARLATLRERLAPAGALWVVRPRGVDSITEADVLAAAREHALVDVKVVRFSETHSAQKLVVPVAARKATKP